MIKSLVQGGRKNYDANLGMKSLKKPKPLKNKKFSKNNASPEKNNPGKLHKTIGVITYHPNSGKRKKISKSPTLKKSKQLHNKRFHIPNIKSRNDKNHRRAHIPTIYEEGMDILESRINKMATETFKSPISGRQKSIERSIALKKQKFGQGLQDWSKPKRNLSTNSYFSERQGYRKIKLRTKEGDSYTEKVSRDRGSFNQSENRLTSTGGAFGLGLALEPGDGTYASLRKSLKLGASTRLRKDIGYGQERQFNQTLSNQICLPNVKDGVKFSDYQLQGRKLGEGAYAVVRPGINLKTGETFAIKTFNKLKLTTSNLKKSVQNEIEILSFLNHCGPKNSSNGIVRYINHYENRRNIHLILEHAGTVDLKTWIDRRKTKTKQGGRKLKLEKGGILMAIFMQICKSVNLLHSKEIVHRDLKMENIVLNFIESEPSEYEQPAKYYPIPEVTIVDFGFSTKIPLSEHTSTICGTPNYMSPELIMKKEVKDFKKTDSWALGVILYYLMAKKFPFTGFKETDLMLQVVEASPDLEGINPEIQDLLTNIFNKNVQERYTVQQILNHPFCLNMTIGKKSHKRNNKIGGYF